MREAHLAEAGLDDAGLHIEAISGAAYATRQHLRRLRAWRLRRPLRHGRLADDRAREPETALEGLGATPGDLVWISAAPESSAA